MIVLAVALACVINGGTTSRVLRQAAWLFTAIAVLIIVQVALATFPRKVVKADQRAWHQ